MGERNRKTQAIILTVKLQGENNRTVQVLSKSEGIFYCTLYGGAKSRFRSLIQPFNIGELYYYNDEVKNQRKITDFDVKSYHPTFSTNIFKMWAANLCCEIVIKTKCAGDSESAFTLLSAVINGMDLCSESQSRLGLLRFLWRYIGLLGVQVNVRNCCICNNFLLSEELKDSQNIYSPIYNGFICHNCSSASRSGDTIYSDYVLNQNALTYLSSVIDLKPGEVRKIELDAETAYQIKHFLYFLIQKEIGPLKTIDSGIGIL